MAGGELAALAGAVRNLQGRVEALEARLNSVPAMAQTESEASILPAATDLQIPPLSHVLGLLGRAFLILGGAYFIRAFTDSGKLPPLAGAFLGLVYASAWGYQGARSPRHQDASVYTLIAAVIAYPLIWETTTVFHAFGPGAAATIYTITTCLLMAVTWRGSLQAAAWCITLGATAAGLALAMATRSLEVFTLVFLGLGGASLWLTYGRRWHGLRWPVALAANSLVLVLTTLLTWTGGPPAAYQHLAPGRGMLLCLGLMLVYLGSFASRMVQRYRPVNAFEIVQTVAVLALGFGGAVRIAAHSHTGLGLLGAAILAAGAACYAVAFYFVEDRTRVQANFLFFTTLALVFIVSGGFLLLSGGAMAMALAGLGLALVLLGLRFERNTLIFHAAAYLVAAALVSTLVDQARQALLGVPPLSPPDGPGVFTLAALGTSHLLLVTRRGPEQLAWRLRMPSFACAALFLFGAGGDVIWAVSVGLGRDLVTPGNLAAVRTGVLALSAVGLAFLSRRFPASECVWLVYPLLALTALKFLFEDLAAGRPLTLFIAFTLYGTALITAPRLLRTETPPTAP